MGYSLNRQNFAELLLDLQDEYKIYGPTRKQGEGTFSDTDQVTYDRITKLEELELADRTKYSAKEIMFPIRQTMFYFQEDSQQEPKLDNQPIIIFLRTCDRNAVKRLDKILLENGPELDVYYRRLRDKVNFFVLECTTGFDSCFCVSMDSNRVEDDDYAAFIRFTDEQVKCEVNDD
jgi:anaerobic sulfite reductase subunit A